MNIAIVGATGMVGRTFIKVIEEKEIKYENMYLFASKKSAGQKLKVNEEEIEVRELTTKSFDENIDIALFSAGGKVSEKYAKIASEKNVIVIDNSSTFRMKEEVPLIVPEVNKNKIKNHKNIIANPNCSTIQCMLPLKALKDIYKIKRINYSTYQSVSGSGVKGIEDLRTGKMKNYTKQIKGNCIPHIDVFLENGYTKEEMKMIEETKKILEDQSLKVTATAVRVPVEYGHCVNINVEFDEKIDLKTAKQAISSFEGVVVLDEPKGNIYPTPLEIANKDEVYVGRIRKDLSVDNGITMWVVADNIRKGAATNAVQIMEYIIKSKGIE